MSQKGDATISVLGTAVIMAIVVIFVAKIIPDYVMSAFEFMSSSSAEVVSRNLAGFITISAAAPNEISIDYFASKSSEYNVKIENRVINLDLLSASFGAKGGSITKAGIDSICYYTDTICRFDGVNHFTIKKWSDEDGYICNVNGEMSLNED